MNGRFGRWLRDWDWRPLARLIVWIALAVAAAQWSGYRLPSLQTVARELVLGWLLTFGLLTRLQLWLAMGALRLFMALDDWTYGLSERLVRPLAGRAPFTINFLAALAVQLALVGGSIASWRAVDLGARLAEALERAMRSL